MTENNIRVSLRIKFPKGTLCSYTSQNKCEIKQVVRPYSSNKQHRNYKILYTILYRGSFSLFTPVRYLPTRIETAAQQGRKPHHKQLTGLNKVSHIQPSNQNI